MDLRKHSVWIMVAMLMMFTTAAFANNIVVNGDLEDVSPAFWYQHEMGGTLSWDWTEAQHGNKSLKIDKPNTGGSATWKSADNGNMYWNNFQGVFYSLSAWIKTDGVNTNPANDGERAAVTFTFLDEGGNEIVPGVPMFADQSSATMDWHEVTADVLLTEEPAQVIMYLWMGGDATGTVWFDNINVSSDPWTAGIFNNSMEEPTGWMSWASDGDVGFAQMVYDEDAYSGDYVAKLMEEDELGDEMVFYSQPAPATGNAWYIISVMVRYDDLNTNDLYYPTSQVPENVQDRSNLCFFYHAGNWWHDWAVTGGDQFLYFDQRTAMSDGWTMYWTVSQAPAEATAFSMRARLNPTAMGTVYYDNFSCVKLDKGDNLVENGDLETYRPFFFHPDQNNGDRVWTDAEAHTGNRSAMITKTGTGEASWMSENQATHYWNNMDGVLYDLSAWFMTDGVNTDPGGEDEMIGVYYHFLDGGGSDIVPPVFLPADQSSASMAWHEVSDQVLLTEAPVECYIELMMGTDATGTVYFDDINFGSDPWTAGCFGGDFETPTGWMHWASTGDVGVADLFNVGDDAYSGEYVAKLIEGDDLGDEMVFYSIPTALEADNYYMFQTMAKTVDIAPLDANLWPSSVMYENIQDRANLCFFFHSGDLENAWNVTGGDQFAYFQQREATEDWTAYSAIAMAPGDATGASMRARFNPTVEGEVWYDDLMIFEMTELITGVDESPFAIGQGPSTLPSGVELSQNYPNPFNAQSIISFSIPAPGDVQLEIYDLLGRRIARLVNDHMAAGTHEVAINAEELGMTASGVYFYRLNTQNGAMVRKMTFIK
jgi:Secretion system C-terminal sorting domain